MTADSNDHGPKPAGPFFSNYGPQDGPIMHGEVPLMGVLDGAGASSSTPGQRVDLVPPRPGQVWRLTVDNRDLV